MYCFYYVVHNTLMLSSSCFYAYYLLLFPYIPSNISHFSYLTPNTKRKIIKDLCIDKGNYRHFHGF